VGLPCTPRTTSREKGGEKGASAVPAMKHAQAGPC
jgi:hypothetical protein